MGFLLTGFVVVAGIILLAWMFQRTLIYFPFGDVPTPSEVGLTQVEEVEFPTADGLRLDGWFVRTASSSPAFTVVVFNGNAGNRAHRAPLAASLQQQGFRCSCSTTAGTEEMRAHPPRPGSEPTRERPAPTF